jgi:glucokinase
MDSYVIGVDIGGTGTKYGIVDKDGNVLHSSTMPTNTHEQVHTYIDELYVRLSELIEKVGGVGRIKGIGIGAPNGNIYTGTIEYAPNLPWKGVIPFAKMVQDKFKLPVKLTNDANAAAVGEMMYGAAKGMKDFIMITLGTGVGSGIVANGQLIYGHDGFAGELGHTIIIPDGRMHPGTGKKGSL